MVGMRLELDRRARVPMYRQLAAQLRERIVSGELAEGYRLPPEREFAARLGVNRTTILQAYQQLKDEGFIASKVGKGTFVTPVVDVPPSRSANREGDPRGVRERGGPRSRSGGVVHTIRDTRPPDPDPEPSVVPPPWSVLFSDYSNRFTYHDIASADRAQRGGTVIDFASGSPNPGDIPDDLLRAVSVEAFSSHEFDGRPESPIEGFAELRALLADHMRSRGVRCDERNVMVLSGSEQGIDLCVRAFVDPGDCVLVEQSTLFSALQAFRSAGARVVGVPMDGLGMRTELLDGYCARFHPKFIYTIPTAHNPTGVTMPTVRRHDLIAAARRHQCLIIEDDAYGDLWYGPLRRNADDDPEAVRPTPVAGMENTGYVIYLSTFSKTVTSGLRTGWIVADPHVVGRLAALRRMIDQHTSTSSQRICMELLREGRIGAHVDALTRAYRERRDRTVAALQRHAPDGMRWTVPEGGYYVWATLPRGVRALALLERCRAESVTFMPGAVFDVDETDDSHIRLNFVRPAERDLDEGVRIICGAVSALQGVLPD